MKIKNVIAWLLIIAIIVFVIFSLTNKEVLEDKDISKDSLGLELTAEETKLLAEYDDDLDKALEELELLE